VGDDLARMSTWKWWGVWWRVGGRTLTSKDEKRCFMITAMGRDELWN